MPIITFLSASVPLTKSFTKTAIGTIQKSAYPMVKNFTSHVEQVKNIAEFYKVLTDHSSKGHCLLKGNLKRELSNEPRKDMTSTFDPTEWICLDFDRYPSETLKVSDELEKLGLGDVSYVVQWSSSHNMPGTSGTLSCHVFMMLNDPLPAPDLKLWLQHLNFQHLNDKISLNRIHSALRWPLDQSTCQNDKLIYITTPGFINIKDPLGTTPRTQLVKGKLDKLPITRITSNKLGPEQLAKKRMDKRNELRRALGLTTTRASITFQGEYEIQNKPGVANITGIKEEDEYVRLNLNDGDSWAYWHHKDNFELLFNFKGEPVYRLKELCPDYYADLVRKSAYAQTQPSNTGDVVLAFRDFKSAQYWNGTWNEDKQLLNLSVARSETQIDHYMQSHGLRSLPYIPIWNIIFEPNEDFVVDVATQRVNRFKQSEYMRAAKARNVNLKKECPTIHKIITNFCGNDDMVIKAFMEWFACIFQRKGKPLTAWVFHGIEGTGKGTFFHRIAKPLLHPDNCFMGSINTIEDKFNDWMIHKLLIMIDEVDVDAFTEKGKVTALFRTYITEPVIPVRGMRIAPFQAPNYFSFMFSSNRPQPVWIPPTDRRYNIARFQSTKLQVSESELVNIPKELQAFADHLQNIETDVNIASQICETPDRERMSKLAVTSIQETANALIDGDFEQLWKSMPDEKHLQELGTLSPQMALASAFATLMRRIGTSVIEGNTRYNRLSRDEIRTIFQYCAGNVQEAPARFKSMLRHSGIELSRMRRDDDRFEGMEIKWRVSDDFKQYLLESLSAPKELKPRLRKVQ